MEIRIEKNDDGFLAACPSVEGAFAEGDTEFEALYNLFDVIRMIGEYKQEEMKSSGKSVKFTIPITV